MYSGQFLRGRRHGFGACWFGSRDSYSGEWRDGMFNGVGLQHCLDSYFGQFEGGAKHGLGCWNSVSGDEYTGQFRRNKMHGTGVYHFCNGDRYEGSWHDGVMQGYGMLTYSNGSTVSGTWDCGILKPGSAPEADRIRLAVEAANTSAGKATSLIPVEEGVKNAVSAAGRAANAAKEAAIRAARVVPGVDERLEVIVV